MLIKIDFTQQNTKSLISKNHSKNLKNMNTKNNTTFLAHVRLDEQGTWHEYDLGKHLREVGRRAGKVAIAFNSADWARLVGIWHDLGKYSEL